MTETTAKTILIVDDISSNIDLLKEILAPHFKLKMVKNGASALKIVNAEDKPDLVLLDVMMPEMDGYEVCRSIKDDPSTAGIPVIFVSALSSSEEQILGYEAGAEDYIGKPVNADDLMAKIHNAFESQKQKQSQKENLNYASSTAMTAMTTISEMGHVTNYFKELPRIKNFDDLANQLLNFIRLFNLTAIIRIDSGIEDPLHQSTKGIVSPLEKSLIAKLSSKSSIFSFKSGTIFNYKYISLLIIDMPLENKELYGRLKDHFSTIVEGTISAIERIISSKKLLKAIIESTTQNDQLTKLFSTIESVLTLIEEQNNHYQEENREIMLTLTENLETSFLSMGLTEAQEKVLLGQVNATDDKIQDLFDKNIELENKITMMKALINP